MEWATELMESLGYPGIVLVIFLENLFPPIPSEVVLPFAGFLAASGVFSIPGIVLTATIGSVAGAYVLYEVGRIVGRDRLYAFVRKYGRYFTVRESDLAVADRWFVRYGPSVVFFARMVPIVRSLISIPAGVTEMPRVPFLLYTALGTAVWNVLLSSVGAALGENWGRVAGWIGEYQNGIIVLGVAAVAVWVWYSLRRRGE